MEIYLSMVIQLMVPMDEKADRPPKKPKISQPFIKVNF